MKQSADDNFEFDINSRQFSKLVENTVGNPFSICKHFFFFNPFPNNKFWTIPKLKEFADENFKFDENGRKFSKMVENTVGKGEIARYKQFLLYPQCFQKACFPGASKGIIVWEWVKPTLEYKRQ